MWNRRLASQRGTALRLFQLRIVFVRAPLRRARDSMERWESGASETGKPGLRRWVRPVFSRLRCHTD